jgi:gas vesicle protein
MPALLGAGRFFHSQLFCGMQDTKGKVILSLLAGATAGVVAGLLLAPETGDQMRAGLKKSASKLSDDLTKLWQDSLARFGSARTTNSGTGTGKHRTDQDAANDLLSSLNHPRSEADSDYDGIGGDTRHSAGYGR